MTRLLPSLSLFLLAAGAGAPAIQAAAADDAAIVHALNRLTYGPRPGDVERVKAMGLQKWIDLQLTPARIDNGALEARAAASRNADARFRDHSARIRRAGDGRAA